MADEEEGAVTTNMEMIRHLSSRFHCGNYDASQRYSPAEGASAPFVPSTAPAKEPTMLSVKSRRTAPILRKERVEGG